MRKVSCRTIFIQIKPANICVIKSSLWEYFIKFTFIVLHNYRNILTWKFPIYGTSVFKTLSTPCIQLLVLPFFFDSKWQCRDLYGLYPLFVYAPSNDASTNFTDLSRKYACYHLKHVSLYQRVKHRHVHMGKRRELCYVSRVKILPILFLLVVIARL